MPFGDYENMYLGNTYVQTFSGRDPTQLDINVLGSVKPDMITATPASPAIFGAGADDTLVIPDNSLGDVRNFSDCFPYIAGNFGADVYSFGLYPGQVLIYDVDRTGTLIQNGVTIQGNARGNQLIIGGRTYYFTTAINPDSNTSWMTINWGDPFNEINIPNYTFGQFGIYCWEFAQGIIWYYSRGSYPYAAITPDGIVGLAHSIVLSEWPFSVGTNFLVYDYFSGKVIRNSTITYPPVAAQSQSGVYPVAISTEGFEVALTSSIGGTWMSYPPQDYTYVSPCHNWPVPLQTGSTTYRFSDSCQIIDSYSYKLLLANGNTVLLATQFTYPWKSSATLVFADSRPSLHLFSFDGFFLPSNILNSGEVIVLGQAVAYSNLWSFQLTFPPGNNSPYIQGRMNEDRALFSPPTQMVIEELTDEDEKEIKSASSIPSIATPTTNHSPVETVQESKEKAARLVEPTQNVPSQSPMSSPQTSSASRAVPPSPVSYVTSAVGYTLSTARSLLSPSNIYLAAASSYQAVKGFFGGKSTLPLTSQITSSSTAESKTPSPRPIVEPRMTTTSTTLQNHTQALHQKQTEKQSTEQKTSSTPMPQTSTFTQPLSFNEQLIVFQYALGWLQRSTLWGYLQSWGNTLQGYLPWNRVRTINEQDQKALNQCQQNAEVLIEHLEHYKNTRVANTILYRDKLLPFKQKLQQLSMAVSTLLKSKHVTDSQLSNIANQINEIKAAIEKINFKQLNKALRQAEIDDARLERRAQRSGQRREAQALVEYKQQKCTVRHETKEERLNNFLNSSNTATASPFWSQASRTGHTTNIKLNQAQTLRLG